MKVLIWTAAAVAVVNGASQCDLGSWNHLMTVNPSDGKVTFKFDSKYWYKGSYGSFTSGNDYISGRVRMMPIEKIKIISKNIAGEEAMKVYTLDSEH